MNKNSKKFLILIKNHGSSFLQLTVNLLLFWVVYLLKFLVYFFLFYYYNFFLLPFVMDFFLVVCLWSNWVYFSTDLSPFLFDFSLLQDFSFFLDFSFFFDLPFCFDRYFFSDFSFFLDLYFFLAVFDWGSTWFMLLNDLQNSIKKRENS